MQTTESIYDCVAEFDVGQEVEIEIGQGEFEYAIVLENLPNHKIRVAVPSPGRDDLPESFVGYSYLATSLE